MADPKTPDTNDSAKSEPENGAEKGAEQSETSMVKDALKYLADAVGQKGLFDLPKTKKLTGQSYTNLKLDGKTTVQVRKMIKDSNGDTGVETATDSGITGGDNGSDKTNGKAKSTEAKTAADNGGKPGHIEYSNGTSRDVTYGADGKPKEINYKDPSTQYEDNWSNIGGTDVWVQKNKDGKLTGKTFSGEVDISENGTLTFKDSQSGTETKETTGGIHTTRTSDGVALMRAGGAAGPVTDIEYEDGNFSSIHYDADGKPSSLMTPYENIERRPDGKYAVTNVEPPDVYDDVSVDHDGVITMKQGDKTYTIDPKTDHRKEETSDTKPAPEDKTQAPGRAKPGDGPKVTASGKTEHIDYYDGRTRDVTYGSDGKPQEIKYEDPANNYKDSWTKLPDSDVWVQKDGNGKPTGETFTGEVEFSENGTLTFTEKATGTKIQETNEGTHTTTTRDGVRIMRDGGADGKVTDIDYEDGNMASVHYDESGQPNRIMTPYENIERRADGKYVTNSEPPGVYDDVSVDKNGVITLEEKGEKYTIDPAKDFRKEETADSAKAEQEKPSHIENDRTSRDIEYDEKGEANVVHYTDKSTGYQDSWRRQPGSDVWEQHSADGKPTGKTFEGKISVGDDKSLTYQKTGEDTATVETADGQEWTKNPDGVLVSEDEGKVEFRYPNDTQSAVAFDEQGKPNAVIMPDGMSLAKQGNTWVEVDNNGQPVPDSRYKDVQVREDGTIKLTDYAQNSLTYHPDGSKDEMYADGTKVAFTPAGKPESVNTPSPNPETVSYTYDKDGNVDTIDYGHGNKWKHVDDDIWMNQGTNEVWRGDLKVHPDGSYSYRAENSSEVITKTPNGSRVSTDQDGSIIETRNGAAIAIDKKERIASVETPTGVNRSFKYSSNNEVTEVSYSNAQTGLEESWKKEGDSWRRYDADGKPTDKTWEGDIEVDQNTGDYLYRSAGSNEVTKEKPDGSSIKADGNLITETHSSTGENRQFEYTDGKMTAYSDASGRWTTTNGTEWLNAKTGEVREQRVSVDGEGTFTVETRKETLHGSSDGKTVAENKDGSKRLYNDEGRLTETIDKDGKVYKYAYDEQGKVNSVTGPDNVTYTTQDGTHWSSTDGSKTFNGSVEVNPRDGSLKVYDEDKKLEQTFRVDGSKTMRDRNPQSETYGQISTQKDGKTKIDRKAIDKNALQKSADAFFEAADGAGTYIDDMQAQLKGKSEEERAYMDEYYTAKRGYSMAAEVEDEIEDPAQREKTLAMINDKDDTDADNNAAFVKENLTQIDSGASIWDSAEELYKKATDDEAINTSFREKISSMNSEEIAQMNESYKSKDPSGQTAIDAILANPNIDEATKDALQIYSKGTDKLTDEDYQKVADIALAAENPDMFKEAMAHMSQDGREKYLSESKDGKTGQQKIQETFETWYDSDEYKDALDYAQHGKQSEARSFEKDAGYLDDSERGVETKIKNMSSEDRQLYSEGKEIARKNGGAPDESKLSPEEKSAYRYYKQTSDALSQVAGRGSAEFKKYEDMIVSGADGSLIAKAYTDDGYIDNSNVDEVIESIEKMDQKTWDRLKSEPGYADDLKAMYGEFLDGPEYDRVAKMIDDKKSAESYEKSQDVRRSTEEALGDSYSWWSGSKSPAKVLSAIESMTPADQQKYRDNTDGFRDKVDGAIAEATQHNPIAARALGYVTNKIDRGESPKEDIITKAYNHATTETDVNESQVVSEVMKTFKENPELRERIKNDPEYAKEFKDAMSAAVGPDDYETYIKPLAEGKPLTAENIHDLYDGYFDDDEVGFYQAIKDLPPDEQKKMLESPSDYLEFLSDQDREIATNVLKQGGEMKPADKMRAYMLGSGTSEQEMKDLMANMTPEEIEDMKRDYAAKYGSDLTADAIGELSGKDKRTVEKGLQGPQSASSSLNDAIEDKQEAKSSMGSGIADAWDSTGSQVDDQVVQYSKAVGEYAAQYEKMPPEIQKEFEEKIQTAVEAHIQSQGAIVDAAVDAAITVAALAGAIPSGGASLGMVALTGFAGGVSKVATKSVMLGDAYDFEADAAADFASGAASAATSLIGGGGAIKGTAVIAEGAAKTAVKSAASTIREGAEEIAEQEIKAAVKEAIDAGAKEVSEQTIKDIAKQIAKPGMEAQAEAAIKKGIEQGIKEQAKEVLKQTIKEGAKDVAAGMEGGAIGGAISSLKELDNDKTLSENLKKVFEATATGAAAGAVAAIGFKTAVGAGKALGSKIGKGSGPDAPDAPPPSDSPSGGSSDSSKTPAKGPNKEEGLPQRSKQEPDGDASGDVSDTLTPIDTQSPTASSDAGADMDPALADTMPKIDAPQPAGPDVDPDLADTGIFAAPTPPQPGTPATPAAALAKPGAGIGNAPTQPTTPQVGGNQQHFAPNPADFNLPDDFPTLETPGIGLDELPPGVEPNTMPEIEIPGDTKTSFGDLTPPPVGDRPTYLTDVDSPVVAEPGPIPNNPAKTAKDLPAAKVPQVAPKDTSTADTVLDMPAVEPGKFKSSKDKGGKLPKANAASGTADTQPEIPITRPEIPAANTQPEIPITRPEISPPTQEMPAVTQPDIPALGDPTLTDMAPVDESTLPEFDDQSVDPFGDTPLEVPATNRPADVTSGTGSQDAKTQPDPAANQGTGNSSANPGPLPSPAPGPADDFWFGIRPSSDPAKADTLPAIAKPPDAKLYMPREVMDVDVPDATIETNAIGLDELPPGTNANTFPELMGIGKTEPHGFALKDQPTWPDGPNPDDVATNPRIKLPENAATNSPLASVDDTTLDGGVWDDAPTIPDATPSFDPNMTPREIPLPKQPKVDPEEMPTGEFPAANKPRPSTKNENWDDTKPGITIPDDDEAIPISDSDILEISPATPPPVPKRSPELPEPELPPPSKRPPPAGPAKDMEVLLDEDFADDFSDVKFTQRPGYEDTQIIELPTAKKPARPDVPQDLAKKIEAAETAPLPKPDVNASATIKSSMDLAKGEYGSRVEMEINGTSVTLERPPGEGYYYNKPPSTDDVKTSPSANKVHIEAGSAEELAKMQAVLIPALEKDPALKALVTKWKTIDPRYTTANPQYGYEGADLGQIGPPKNQAAPGDRGQHAKAFTLYVGDARAADAVAKRMDEILGQYPEFQGKDVIPTGNSDTIVGDTNRVGVVKDYLPKAPESDFGQQQAKIDDEIGDAIKNDAELAAKARKNGTSPLTELEKDLGLKPGSVHEDAAGNIVIDLPKQKFNDYSQYEKDIYLDESEAGKQFGQKTARPAIYAIYKKYGYDPKDF